MSTAATTVRTPLPSSARVASAAPAGAGHASVALGTLDPVRLLKRYYPWLIVAAILGAALGVAGNFILAKYAPRYTAVATFACSPVEHSSVLTPLGQGLSADEYTRFMGTQAEFMTSPLVADRAMEQPEVEQTQWAQSFIVDGRFQPAKAARKLMDEISARPVTNTSWIKLSMSCAKADDAQVLVSAVSKAYQEQYRLQQSKESVGRRDAINKQIADIDRKTRDLTSARDRKMQDMNVTDLHGGGSASEDVAAMRLNETLVQNSRDLSYTTSLLDNYMSLETSGAAVAYPDSIRQEAKRDPVVAQLDSQIANLRTDERSLLNQGFGAEHPTVIATRKRIEAAVQERDDALQSAMAKTFAAAIDNLRIQKQGLMAQIDDLNTKLVAVNKRKEDLVRLRVDLDQTASDLARLETERSDLVQARNNIESILNETVFERVSLIQPAQKPSEMSFPKLQIMVPLGVILLTGLVGGLLVLREMLDQRVKGPADVNLIPRMRVLGMVPDANEDPVKAANLETAFRDAPQGVVAESFRQLRSPITKKMDTDGYRTALVLAGMPGSGATTVVTNLALACAAAGERVLLIDANLRRPALHRAFGMGEAPGLGECLSGEAKFSDSIRPTSAENLSLLTAGSASSRMLPERLSSEGMSRLLAEAAGKFDRVFIDAPPAIVSGDGMALANRCDCVVLVVRALAEKRGLVNRLRLQLGEARGEFLGVIVNAVRSSAGGYFKGNIKATHEYQSQGR